jgi:hypothetical protein
MTVQPGQKIASLAAQATAGLIPMDTGGPTVASIPAGGGSFIANGVTPVTVADKRVTANSIIVFTLKTVGGTVGAIPAIQTITPGTGFTVAGTASDTSTYNYAILG